ncbi:MAG TPA: sigma-70 family RNA polymerase sigma factor [bacterium]|nr:sigma-70 family RNA polymerase sigma factor [bacterium]HPP29823.1 sigma-70 family RNA polymerase sigma factor [bacterium]
MVKAKEQDNEIKLLERIKKGDMEAKEQFVKENQGLVVYLAKKYAFTPDILPDLIAEGNMGLLKAVDKFDAKKKVKFGTYAYFWIKRFIIRAIIREFEVLKIPERYQELKDKVEEVKREYMFKKGEIPTDKEIAESLNLPVEVLKKLKRYTSQVRVISSDFYDGEKQVDLFDVMDFSKREELNVWEILRNKDLLKSIFDRLREKEKKANVEMWLKVLEMYYGLDGKVPLSYKEISKELNVSRQRIHQVKKTCLQKLAREWRKMKKEEEKRDDRDKIIDKDNT